MLIRDKNVTIVSLKTYILIHFFFLHEPF